MLATLIKNKLDQFAQAALLRKRIMITERRGNWVKINDESCINFCSNDYLDLINHPAIKEAFIDGIQKFGVGSGSSALISGYLEPQQAIEEKFAEFLNRDRAIFFNSGYLANLGIITSLANRDSIIISDKLCHASLLDAIQLSRAKHYRYKHNNLDHLQFLLSSKKPNFVITEGVFSMEGDLSPLPAIINSIQSNYHSVTSQRPSVISSRSPLIPRSSVIPRLVRGIQANKPFYPLDPADKPRDDEGGKGNELNTLCILDDAHGIGVLGKSGGGSCEHWGLTQSEIPCLITPLGKAFGGAGAVVSGPKNIMEAVLQFSKSYRNTTALPPAICVAALKALEIIQTETWRREKLNQLIQVFIRHSHKRGLKLISNAITPIKCLLVSDNKATQMIQQEMIKKGFFISCIRPPTVPKGTARIRISLNCLHTEKQITEFIDQLASFLC